MAKRSPLTPGAYGRPQRWHEILADAAGARAAEREEKRRRGAETAETFAFWTAVISGLMVSLFVLFR